MPRSKSPSRKFKNYAKHQSHIRKLCTEKGHDLRKIASAHPILNMGGGGVIGVAECKRCLNRYNIFDKKEK